MTASPKTCSMENWTPVIEHGEDNESGIRTCLRQRWSHAAFPTTPGKPLRQTVPSGVVPATPVYEERRCDALRDKRMRRKAIQQPSSNIDTFLCHVCGRLCASRIGLHSQHKHWLRSRSVVPTAHSIHTSGLETNARPLARGELNSVRASGSSDLTSPVGEWEFYGDLSTLVLWSPA